MQLCDDGHEDICYEGSNCPMCEMMSTLNDKISDLQQEVDNKENELYDLRSELRSLQVDFDALNKE